MRVLLFGDVVAKPGRNILAALLPQLREDLDVDYVIANAENLAHGTGITRKTLDELFAAGVDFCTSGNHVLKKEGLELLADATLPVLRPANFPADAPGRGSAIVTIGEKRLLIINLIGTAFFRDAAQYSNPFTTVDAILQAHENEQLSGIIVDIHAETTSEKVAMGLYIDGRVSAVMGSHTHVPTDDARILPAGTAYRTDMGMTGLRDMAIGVDADIVIHNFLHPEDHKAHRWSDHGMAQLHGTLVDIDPATRRATRIEKIDRELEV